MCKDGGPIRNGTLCAGRSSQVLRAITRSLGGASKRTQPYNYLCKIRHCVKLRLSMTSRPRHFFSGLFRPFSQLPRSYDYTYDGLRSRVRAAGASGWALRRRRGRASSPVRGRRSAQVAGPPAKHSPRPCSQRRAGPRQRALPTNAWPSRKTPRRALLAARGGLGAGPSRERNPAQQCSSGLRSRSPGPEASAGHPLRVRVRAALASLRDPQRGPVHLNGARMRVTRSCIRGTPVLQHSAPPLAVAP